MIINNLEKKDAVITGDITENEVKIDTRNIDFIIQLLTTNLYSNPIKSFLRETVSNAWDSHVEAKVNKPVLIVLNFNNVKKPIISIIDEGVGISKERFNTIYKYFGSSTKRNSNEQIGGFGIGRFSILSVANMGIITSVYDGEETKYAIYKDITTIKIDEISNTTTDRSNGVRVDAYIDPEKSSSLNSTIYEWIRAIKEQLLFFDNVEVKLLCDDCSQFTMDIEIFNNTKIYKFNDFWRASYNNHTNILDNHISSVILGNITYSLNTTLLSSETRSHYQVILSNDCYPHFDIGELTVTPNREQILYTKETINNIEQKIDKIWKYLNKIKVEKRKKSYTLEEALEIVASYDRYFCITLDDNHPFTFFKESYLKTALIENTNCSISDFCNAFDVVYHTNLHSIKHISRGKLSSATPYPITYTSKNTYFYYYDKRITQAVAHYLCNELSNKVYILNKSTARISYRNIINALKIIKFNNKKEVLYAIKCVIRKYASEIPTLEIPEEYIKEYNASIRPKKSVSKLENQEIRGYKLDTVSLSKVYKTPITIKIENNKVLINGKEYDNIIFTENKERIASYKQEDIFNIKLIKYVLKIPIVSVAKTNCSKLELAENTCTIEKAAELYKNDLKIYRLLFDAICPHTINSVNLYLFQYNNKEWFKKEYPITWEMLNKLDTLLDATRPSNVATYDIKNTLLNIDVTNEADTDKRAHVLTVMLNTPILKKYFLKHHYSLDNDIIQLLLDTYKLD